MKRVSITMLTVGLLFLLSACVIEPGMNSGQKVAIRFAASNGDEAGDDIVLRSAATATSETQTVSLGGDFFLYATLTPAAAGTASELRAAAPLANGQKVYLSAYETGTGTHKGTVLYTYTNGNLVAEGGNGLEVETGSTYNFTAYSYYNNTTDTPSATNVDPAKDLIWGQQANKAITADDQTVSIVMTRRFARAKVRIGTNIPGAAILAPLGAVTITSSYADLSVPDGVLSKGADITHTVNFPPFTSTDSIVSNETYTVYPGVKVNIASLIIDVPGQDGTPFTRSDISLGFNSLTGGKSYVLEVSVRRRRWAWSSIYWQAVAAGNPRAPGYMTFDTTDQGHQGYQGVYFRCGSLVGTSPGGIRYRYIPNYVDSASTTSTWSISETSPGWNDIPYFDSSYDGEPYGSDDNTYVITAGRNTPELYAGGRGDICQYLGKTDSALIGYRLPISSEFQLQFNLVIGWNTETPSATGWLKGSGSFAGRTNAGSADGRMDLLSTANEAGIVLGSGINQMMGLVLPASGDIALGPYVSGVGGYGRYSTGDQPNGSGWNRVVSFDASTIEVMDGNIRGLEHRPVLCIRKLPGE